ncbi:MAG: PaaI family thioesterase [Planctomycetales bacterium]|nr:PaaI family thioesterase [Planctomycetales bacterium]
MSHLWSSHQVTAKQPNSRMCFICGLQNDKGMQAEFYEVDSNQVIGVFHASEHFQGYPGRLHGGMASALLDECVGRAIRLTHGDTMWGVTIDLNVKFRKPVTLNEPLLVVGRIAEEKRRRFHGTGEILLPNGTVAVEANGTYLKMPIKDIAGFDPQHEAWEVIPKHEDPTEIRLPQRSFN